MMQRNERQAGVLRSHPALPQTPYVQLKSFLPRIPSHTASTSSLRQLTMSLLTGQITVYPHSRYRAVNLHREALASAGASSRKEQNEQVGTRMRSTLVALTEEHLSEAKRRCYFVLFSKS